MEGASVPYHFPHHLVAIQFDEELVCVCIGDDDDNNCGEVACFEGTLGHLDET